MRKAIDETDRRREKQDAFNKAHGIQPFSIVKEIYDITARLTESASIRDGQADYDAGEAVTHLPMNELKRIITETEERMKIAAQTLEFERAAVLRDQIYELRRMLADESKLPPWKKVAILTGEDEPFNNPSAGQ
jgi:excinuclease ABC subunit B